jgi:hypothetical protein
VDVVAVGHQLFDSLGVAILNGRDQGAVASQGALGFRSGVVDGGAKAAVAEGAEAREGNASKDLGALGGYGTGPAPSSGDLPCRHAMTHSSSIAAGTNSIPSGRDVAAS